MLAKVFRVTFTVVPKHFLYSSVCFRVFFLFLVFCSHEVSCFFFVSLELCLVSL